MNVVDSCGWLAYIAGDSNADFFAPAIEQEAQLIVPRVVVYEVMRRLLALQQTHAIAPVLSVMQRCQKADLDDSQLLAAAQNAARYKLAMADAIIWQTAQANQAMLYTQDADLQGLPGVVYQAKARPGLG